MPSTQTTALLLSGLLSLAAAGCNKERSDAAQRPESPSTEQPARSGQAPSADAKARYDEAKFSLELAPKGEYKAGEPGEVSVVLLAKAPFKCNDKYPYKLKLEQNEGMTLERTVITKDAMALEKHKAVMSVPITPTAAGTRRVSGEFSFSVCTEDKCLIEKRQLALDVTVH